MPDEPKQKPVTYADAGVDISRGDRAKERIKFLAQKTFNRNVLGGIGGFGALFRLDLQRWKNPILVSSADGVGTKLKLAFELGMHHTVGVDLDPLADDDVALLHGLISRHADLTQSPRAKWILECWEQMLPKFIKVFPREYKRVLALKPVPAVAARPLAEPRPLGSGLEVVRG